jgi:hypothetical protein
MDKTHTIQDFFIFGLLILLFVCLVCMLYPFWSVILWTILLYILITPPLYKDFPTPEALAATTPEVIFEYIRSVSYPNNKAKHLVGMAKMLVNDFNSQVPDNLDDLIKLPGVGRKTANVVMGDILKNQKTLFLVVLYKTRKLEEK